MQFLKYVLATIVGLLLFWIITILFFFTIGSLFGGSDEVKVKENSVLHIDFNKQIVENASEDDPFSAFLDNGISQMGLVSIKETLKNAALDPNIKGIYMRTEYPMAGMATLEEIHAALKEFKESGKFIISYGEVMTEPALYLSSVADEIVINEAGALEFNGLSAELTFFKGMFDKVGLEPVIFRVGKYKSFIEPYTLTKMSEENKEQVSSYLNDISSHFYGQIAANRGLAKERVDEILNMPVLHTPEDAQKYGLITKVGYKDAAESLVKEKLGIKDDKSVTYISFGKYQKAKKYAEKGDRNSRIAVIIGQGSIVSGESDGTTIASDSWIKELDKAVEDKKVKAIVLRINSGGGSALASDIMWHEIEKAKKKKPVIASMGDYAASGGYYMAMGCDTIVANPSTVTGSIGIFGLLFNTEKLMNDKLGITFDGVKTHAYADVPKITSSMSTLEKQMIQNTVEKGYDTFTQKAAQGRNMSVEKLRELAGGRVWTGSQAKENGLVDVLGSLEDAIEIAATKAGVENYRVMYYPRAKSQFEIIMDRLENSAQVRFEDYFGTLAPEMKKIKQVLELDKLQAAMPYAIQIQ